MSEVTRVKYIGRRAARCSHQTVRMTVFRDFHAMGNRSPSEGPHASVYFVVRKQLVRFISRAVWLVYLSSLPPAKAVAPARTVAGREGGSGPMSATIDGQSWAASQGVLVTSSAKPEFW